VYPLRSAFWSNHKNQYFLKSMIHVCILPGHSEVIFMHGERIGTKTTENHAFLADFVWCK
jgi:hypothetical protein